MLRFDLSVVALGIILSLARPAGLAADPASQAAAKNRDGNRLAYLDENNPWYPHRNFPKLITPQWVGEDGVDCVVILAIDDMREPAKYEAYLRPILDRLKQIDGRAPVSIMTCNVKPDDPQLSQWLAEGLSIEVHTVDHPCPLLQGGDFAKAKSTYDRCVDLLHEIPGNKPVAFRMPCCDSLNTVSPRFYREIFNQTTPGKNSLAISSSVFNLLTPDDPDIPRELLFDPDGRDKFRKYIPKGLIREGQTFNTFVNYIEDYPYPYVIDRLCWEFPCVVPSDWSAQFLQKPNNPDTLRDWKAALDIIVRKQGVYNLVFHPHNWIKPEQVVELIDHAVTRHGRKVKFLTFREALERIDKNLLAGVPLRAPAGGREVRLADVDNDGYLDVSVNTEIKLWSPSKRRWNDPLDPVKLPVRISDQSRPQPERSIRLASKMPAGIKLPQRGGRDTGLRFVDVNEDGYEDIVFSNAERYGIYLFENMQTGWSRVALEGIRGLPAASNQRKPADANKVKIELPPIVRTDGTDNGFFVHSRHLFWQNEDTAKLPDLVDRRSFNEIIAQADLPPTPKTPEAATKSIHVLPGFTVELMAAEPLVLDPISFEFGPDGKLWVVEMGDYPLGAKEKPAEPVPGKKSRTPLEQGGGQIRCLVDSDGDGTYDKGTVFLEVPYPTGVLPWKKGVLVVAAPNVIYAEDKDGDGHADTREVLYTGFSEGNQQHRANGLVRGLDNWIYIANGDSGGMIESKMTGKKVAINGRDLRIHPASGDLEAVAGQTQFGRSRDDWGNWFGCNNSNPMYQFVLDDFYQRRNPHFSGATPRIDVPEVAGNAPVFPISPLLERFNDFHTANRFTSACSAMTYRDDLFGPHFAGNAFICEPVHNLVHREVMTQRGVTFSSRRAPGDEQSEFLASTDNWFRPTTVKTGPDGALWIADMYRHVIEHPQWIPDTWQKRLDLRAGHDKGRIYRVAPVDRKPRAIPRLDQLDTAGLVAALDSPSGWQRDTAQQLLIERHDEAAIRLLERQLAGHANPLCRLHALCTLSGLESISESVLVTALADAHPGVRRQAVRLTTAPARKISPALVARLIGLSSEPDPLVRLQLAYALGEIQDVAEAQQAGTAIGTLLVADGDDRFLFSALMSSINQANVESVLSGVLHASQNRAPQQNLIGSLLDLAAAMGNNQALAKLVWFVTDEGGNETRPWQLSAMGRLLDSLSRRNELLADKLKKSNVPDLDRLLAAVDRLFAVARNLVTDTAAPIEARQAAVRLLGRGRNERESDLELLGTLLPPQSPVELQTAAVEGLGRLRDDRVPGLLLGQWRGFGPARRSQVLDALLSRDAWAADLLTAVADGRVARTDFDAARRQRLLEHRSLGVRQQAEQVFAGAQGSDRQKVVDSFQTTLTHAGDPARGAQLFLKTCAQCHKLAGAGYEVGPDLTSLTDKSPEALLVAILDPNRAVETKFVTYVAQTKSGLTYSGLLASETGNSITLLAPESKQQVVLRADLEDLVSTSKSTMPEGLEKDLAPQDLADIIAHVRSNIPLPKRKEFSGNEPQTIQPAADGTFLLSAASCEIYGSTLIFEPQFKNLGYWSSPDDHAVWQVDVPHSGKFAIEFDWACDGSVAGNEWELQTAGRSVTGKVGSTGGWETYRQAMVGEISLSAGAQRIVMRARRKPQGALVDLKSVRLTPMK